MHTQAFARSSPAFVSWPLALVAAAIPPEPQQPVSRLIHRIVDPRTIPVHDAKFYRRDAERSRTFRALDAKRRAYVKSAPNLVLVFTCIDEREQDFECTTGLPIGVANVIQIAGNKIGRMNLALCKEIQLKIDKANRLHKSILLLFVTHESRACPATDSCAAWQHSITAADAHAALQVARFSRDYVDRNARGGILRRHLVAFHVKSVTDTEAKIWCGEEGRQLDPMEYVHQHHALRGTRLVQHIRDRLIALFPRTSWRFEGWSHTQWRVTLHQITQMIVANVQTIRTLTKRPRRIPKQGHRGTRALVGRGWEMYDTPGTHFKVGDFAPESEFRKDIRIAATYLVRNGLLKRRRRFGITFHVNILYDRGRPGDRSGSIRHAMDLARLIKNDLTRLLTRKRSRKKFDAAVKAALVHEGVQWRSLPLVVRQWYRTKLLRNLRVYTSVSTRETRALELVATNGDLCS